MSVQAWLGTELDGAPSRHSQAVGSIPAQGTFKNQPMMQK